jgi:hypothetical protein
MTMGPIQKKFLVLRTFEGALTCSILIRAGLRFFGAPSSQSVGVPQKSMKSKKIIYYRHRQKFCNVFEIFVPQAVFF